MSPWDRADDDQDGDRYDAKFAVKNSVPVSLVSTQNGSWSDEEEEPVKVQNLPVSNFVPDAWDASDNEEEILAEKQPEKALTPVKTKTKAISSISKASEKKVSSPAGAAAAAKLPKKALPPQAKAEPQVIETPAERKARMQKEQLKADAENVADLFEGIAKVNINDVPETFLPHLPAGVKPEKLPKEYFDMLLQSTVENFTKLQKNSHYYIFIDNLLKKITENMASADIRKLSTNLSVAANEKQRQEKAAVQKKKKPTKQQANIEPDNQAFNSNDVEYDEFDSFM